MALLQNIYNSLKRNILDKTKVDEKIGSYLKSTPNKARNFFTQTLPQFVKNEATGGKGSAIDYLSYVPKTLYKQSLKTETPKIDLSQNINQPVAKTAVSMLQSIPNAFMQAPKSTFEGSYEVLNNRLRQLRGDQVPWQSDVKSLAKSVELPLWLMTGGKGKELASLKKTSLGNKILQGSKTGRKIGSLFGAQQSAKDIEETDSLSQAALKTGVGTVTGAVIGTGIGATVPIFSHYLNKSFKNFKELTKSIEKLPKAEKQKVIKAGFDILHKPEGSYKIQKTPEGAIRQIGSGFRPLSPTKNLKTIVGEKPQIPVEKMSKFGEKPSMLLEAPRAFSKWFGKNWENVKGKYWDKLDYAKSDAVKFKDKYNKIISDLNIPAGSKLSKYVQLAGEKKIGKKELIKQLGQKDADKVLKADKVFRNVYQDILKEINSLRESSGLSPIKERQDYYRHLGESGSSYLETLIHGGTRGEKGQSIMKLRKGDKTQYDAVKGYSDYIERASHLGYLEPQIKNFQSLLAGLKKNKNTPEGLVKDLQQYIDQQLRGVQKKPSDIESVNFAVNVLDKGASTVRANQILGNISSLLAQSLNLPTGIWRSGPLNAIKGVMFMPKNIKIINSMPFIADRAYRQPIKFSTGLGKVKAPGGAAMQHLDLATTRMIGSMFYQKALHTGVKNPVKWASDQTRLVMGGRGVGDFSKLQSSKFGNTFVPFSLEVQSGLNTLGEMVSERKVGELIGYFITAYGVNESFEKLSGFRPLVDPIDTAIDVYKYANGTDEKKQSWLRVIGRVIAGATEFNPVAQNALALTYPILEHLTKDEKGKSYLPSSRDIFGSDDPTRFGSVNMYLPKDSVITGNRPLDLMLNPLLQYTPTGYGNQAKKTLAGLFAHEKGYTQSKKGNVIHPVDQDVKTKLRMAGFGPWSTERTREAFQSDYTRPLDSKESELFKTLPKGEQREKMFENIQSGHKQTGLFKAPEDKKGILDRIFKKEEKFEWGVQPVTKEQKQSHSEKVDIALKNNLEVPDKDLITRFFDGQTYYTEDIETKEGIIKAALEIQKDEYLTSEQKKQIIKASKVSEDKLDYYKDAVKNKRVKYQEILSSLESIEDREELLTKLMAMRRSVAGRRILYNEDVDYLYDHGYITKNEKKLLNAVKYDELTDKFYLDRDFKLSSGSGSKSSISKEQKEKQKELEKSMREELALFKMSMKVVNQSTSNIKSIKSILKMFTQKSDTPKKLDTILKSGQTTISKGPELKSLKTSTKPSSKVTNTKNTI